MTHAFVPTRRDVLKVGAGLFATSLLGAAAPAKPKKLLLRSSWQTVNIGDIAHTPGMLRLIEQHLPEVEVTLWPSSVGAGVEEMLLARFPKLRIAKSTAEKEQALAECDACLHGSGPGLVGRREMERWRETGKPYGFGGVTLNDGELRDQRELLNDAAFVFCRDSDSLKALQATGIEGPQMGWGPDATFVLDLKEEALAEEVLAKHDLTPKKFLCAVPRLRYTPYWEIHKERTYSREEMAMKSKVNEEHREADHAKQRDAIIAWVRKTGQRVLLCPEMTYQVDLLGPLLYDPLPEDVKPHVANLGRYWLTGEAASVYARAAAVLSAEMHSPIISIANSTPAIHLRQPTDTRKGQMWRDVGLEDWLFEIEQATGDQIASRLLEIHGKPDVTKQKVQAAREFVQSKGAAMMEATRGMLATG